jgi:antitoxin component of MazEF toxin-antitoxin module
MSLVKIDLNMKTSIVKIGDAQGVILPESFLAELGRNAKVEVESKDGTLLIKPFRQKNEGTEIDHLLTDLSNEFNLGNTNP